MYESFSKSLFAKTLKRWKLVFMDSIEKYKEISHVIVVSYIGLEKRKDPLNILYWSNRIVEKGHVWEREFNKLLSSGCTQKEIAMKTGLTPPTIRKILRDRKK